ECGVAADGGRETGNERRHRVDVALQIVRERVRDPVDELVGAVDRQVAIVRVAPLWPRMRGLHVGGGERLNDLEQLDVHRGDAVGRRDVHALPKRAPADEVDVEDVFAGRTGDDDAVGARRVGVRGEDLGGRRDGDDDVGAADG